MKDPEVIEGPIPSDTRSVRAALRSVKPIPPNMNRVVDKPDPWDEMVVKFDKDEG